MKNKTVDLSIVIGAYHEAKRIGKTLDELANFIKTNSVIKKLSVELVIVSADSNDKTHEIINAKLSKFKNNQFIRPGPKVGKGRDIRLGMLSAKGKAVIFMDADLATPLSYLPAFYALYLAGNDVVVATRDLKKHHPELLRRVLSITGNVIYRLLIGVWVEDSQCGFKLFSKNACKACFSSQTILGWGFDMEILSIAKIKNLKIITVRINDWRSVPGGKRRT